MSGPLLAVSPDGAVLACVAEDRIALLDPATLTLIRNGDAPAEARSLAFVSGRLAIGSLDAMYTLDLATLAVTAEAGLPGGTLIAGVAGDRAALLVPGGGLGLARCTGRAIDVVGVATGGPVDLAIGVDDERLVIGMPGRTEIVSAVSQRVLSRMAAPLPAAPRTGGVAGQSRYVFVAQRGDPAVTVLRLSDGRTFEYVTRGPVTAVYGHPDSPWIAIAHEGGLERLHVQTQLGHAVEADASFAACVGGGDEPALYWIAPAPDLRFMRTTLTGDAVGPGRGLQLQFGGESRRKKEPPPNLPREVPIPLPGFELPPEPGKNPEPSASQDPSPNPSPIPNPIPNPNPSPIPNPNPNPIPNPNPNPNPIPNPIPNPSPTPIVSLIPDPIAIPLPHSFAMPVAPPPLLPTPPPPPPASISVAASLAARAGSGPRTWRPLLADWARAVLADPAAPVGMPSLDGTPLDALANRLRLPNPAFRGLALLYGAWLAGGARPSLDQVGRTVAWEQVGGDGDLPRAHLTAIVGGRIALRPAVARFLDEAAPLRVELVGGEARREVPTGRRRAHVSPLIAPLTSARELAARFGGAALTDEARAGGRRGLINALDEAWLRRRPLIAVPSGGLDLDTLAAAPLRRDHLLVVIWPDRDAPPAIEAWATVDPAGS